MIQQIKTSDFEEKVLKNKKTVILDFSATWCGPCKMQSKILESFSETFEDVDIYKIDIDDEIDIATKYGIMSIPTLIVFKDGQEYKNHIGVCDEDKLSNLIL